MDNTGLRLKRGVVTPVVAAVPQAGTQTSYYALKVSSLDGYNDNLFLFTAGELKNNFQRVSTELYDKLKLGHLYSLNTENSYDYYYLCRLYLPESVHAEAYVVRLATSLLNTAKDRAQRIPLKWDTLISRICGGLL